MNVNIYDILYVYEKEISKSVKNKKKLYKFERNKMININNIYNILNNFDNYFIKYNIFTIYEPKKRTILSLNVSDKIINHYFTKYVLEKKLDKYLDIRNVASRKGYGVSYGRKLLNKYIEEYKKFDKFYILKLDINGYFYNIDHNVLKSLLIDKLDDNEYRFLCKILESTNYKYVNDITGKYGNNKGLPIGSMSSQILAVFYLHKIDFMIVNDFKLRMVRYQDDYIIISEDKNYLKYVFGRLKEILLNEYKLELNDKKSFIISSNNYFNFLGYNYKVVNKKTIVKRMNSNNKRRKRKLKKRYKEYRSGSISLKSYISSFYNLVD